VASAKYGATTLGGMLAAKEYNNEDWHEDVGWFRPGILRQLGSNPLINRPRLNNPLTEKQIFDCLTSDITNHTLLRNRLIQRYGRQQEITAVFTHFGF
jgi:hypothetical protein